MIPCDRELDLKDLTVFNSYAHQVICLYPDDFHILLIEDRTCVQLSQLEDGICPSLTTLQLCIFSDFDVIPLAVLSLLIWSKYLSFFTYSFRDNNIWGVFSTPVEHVSVNTLHSLDLRGGHGYLKNPLLQSCWMKILGHSRFLRSFHDFSSWSFPWILGPGSQSQRKNSHKNHSLPSRAFCLRGT